MFKTIKHPTAWVKLSVMIWYISLRLFIELVIRVLPIKKTQKHEKICDLLILFSILPWNCCVYYLKHITRSSCWVIGNFGKPFLHCWFTRDLFCKSLNCLEQSSIPPHARNYRWCYFEAFDDLMRWSSLSFLQRTQKRVNFTHKFINLLNWIPRMIPWWDLGNGPLMKDVKIKLLTTTLHC